MKISLQKLIVTGPGKRPAILDLRGQSHLIYGPTDTGKSYVVQCIRYGLGGSPRPEDIGYSGGYTRVILHMTLTDGTEYTVVRNLTDGDSAVYPGLNIEPPQNGPEPSDIADKLLAWSGAAEKKIIIKAGQLGSLTASDLRRVSVFDEIATLNNVPFEGTDVALKTRNKSALALIMSGTDDANAPLVTSTADRQIAKGHVEALLDEIARVKADVPEGISRAEAEKSLLLVSEEITKASSFLEQHEEELGSLKEERAKLERMNQEWTQRLTALAEARERFLLLDKKYENDLLRLQAIGSAAVISTSFEAKECPLCLTDAQHQKRHKSDKENLMLREAASSEAKKISDLRTGLHDALLDLSVELEEAEDELDASNRNLKKNSQKQDEILAANRMNKKIDLSSLSERKTMLTMVVRDLERSERLEMKLAAMKGRTKRKKQTLERNLADSANVLCARVKTLLKDWCVPGVESVYFDEKVGDLEINQRKRISYGKGKRAIFLTAYMVALMEQAIKNGHPHLGFLVIDSPLVTYKDPKHAHDSSEDLLDPSVKDKFYDWLSKRSEKGQLIILENEEPDDKLKPKLSYTEFFGAGTTSGRPGFFPQ